MNSKLLIIGIVVAVLITIVAFFSFEDAEEVVITNFEECAEAGNPVMESYPRQCRADGVLYVEDITEGFDSGVVGKVLLGPMCPVMRDPPDPNCADKPYQTTIQVIVIGSPKSSPFATAETDKDGNYKVILPPGEYSLQAIGSMPFPRCGTKTVIVESNTMHKADLSCDTGIR
ncbi:MAG: hypothetical protein ABH822_01880 [Patescibacteria group bacterium]